MRAPHMALVRRRAPAGCIHHSDRGSQYCANEYQKLLHAHGLRASISGKGNWYDNAFAIFIWTNGAQIAYCESFFKTIKAELILRDQGSTSTQTEMVIANYIDRFYNPVRKHSAIGHQSILNAVKSRFMPHNEKTGRNDSVTCQVQCVNSNCSLRKLFNISYVN